MVKKTAGLLFVLIANILLVTHSILPHHHYGGFAWIQADHSGDQTDPAGIPRPGKCVEVRLSTGWPAKPEPRFSAAIYEPAYFRICSNPLQNSLTSVYKLRKGSFCGNQLFRFTRPACPLDSHTDCRSVAWWLLLSAQRVINCYSSF